MKKYYPFLMTVAATLIVAKCSTVNPVMEVMGELTHTAQKIHRYKVVSLKNGSKTEWSLELK